MKTFILYLNALRLQTLHKFSLAFLLPITFTAITPAIKCRKLSENMTDLNESLKLQR